MRSGLLLAVALAAGGCNQLLGLDPTSLAGGDDEPAADASIDASPCVPTTTADEDDDAVTDDCDLCPHVPDDGRSDGDGDGVGDACDPANGRDDAILLFDSFASDEGGTWTPVRGTWQIGTGALLQTDDAQISALAHRTYELPPEARVDVGFRVLSSPDLGLARGLGVLTYAADFAQSEPDGYECRAAVVGGVSGIELYAWSEAVPDLLDTGPFGGAFDPGEVITVRALRTADGQLDCAISQGAMGGRASATDTVHTAGTIAIRTIRTAVEVEHVVVIGPEPGL
jgi:hypothetical protein